MKVQGCYTLVIDTDIFKVAEGESFIDSGYGSKTLLVLVSKTLKRLSEILHGGI